MRSERRAAGNLWENLVVFMNMREGIARVRAPGAQLTEGTGFEAGKGTSEGKVPFQAST